MATVTGAMTPLVGVDYHSFHRVRDTLLRLLVRAVITLAFAAILAPMLIIVLSSVSQTQYFAFPPRGFSVVAYQRFWADLTLRQGLRVSVELALATMVLTMMTAGSSAYALDRFRFTGRRVVETILMAPLMLPQVVLAIAILMFLSSLRLPRNFWILVMTHVLIATPFALRVLLSSLATFDRTLEEASASLGARPLRTLLKITLPILQPGVLSAAVLTFVISFGNISASMFLAGAGMITLPVAIFTAAEFGYDVAITAVSVIVIVVSLVVVGIIERVTGLERML